MDARIATWTGKLADPFDMQHDDIDIRDIAHALSNQCRYLGHSRFYSVAEHSVNLAYAIRDRNDLARHALLHDASEAYLGDIVRPLKKRPEFKFYLEVEAVLQARIYRRFGLDEKTPKIVDRLDKEIIDTEARKMFDVRHPDWKLGPSMPVLRNITGWGWPPDEAERAFLRRAEGLGLC